MKVIATVNTVIDRDKFQEKEIDNIKIKIAELEEIIQKLKLIEMNDKKLELKSLSFLTLAKIMENFFQKEYQIQSQLPYLLKEGFSN